MTTRAEASYQETALLIIYRIWFQLDRCKAVVERVYHRTSTLCTEEEHISSDSPDRHKYTYEYLTSAR